MGGKEDGESDDNDTTMVLRLKNGKETTYKLQEQTGVEPRFFFGLCPVSLRTALRPRPPELTCAPGRRPADPALKACSGCLSVCYAGREEQKADWKRHKKVCKVLQPLVKSTGGRHHPLSGHPERSSQVRALLEGALGGGELGQFETDLLVYPRLCAVCLSGDEAALSNCVDCAGVAYCSQEHRDEDAELHAKSCRLLSICLSDHAADASTAAKGGLAGALRGFRPSIRSSSLQHEFLPVDMERFLLGELRPFWEQKRKEEEGGGGGKEDLFWPALRHASLRLTGPLTVLRGLEASGLLDGGNKGKKNRHRRLLGNSLVIHLAGARTAEARDLHAWEVIPARLPSVVQVTIVFVGPELSCPFPAEDFEHESAALKLQRPELRVRYVFCRKSYADAVRSLPKPNLVVALNCGFIFYKTWDSSIPHLLDLPGVPLVFTEYYLEDCQLNLQKVDSLVEDELEVILAPSPNPYCSMLPARIPTGFAFRRFKRRSVVMSNDFICVVRAALEEEEE